MLSWDSFYRNLPTCVQQRQGSSHDPSWNSFSWPSYVAHFHFRLSIKNKFLSASIRAYNAQNIFRSELKKHIDTLARTSYCFYDINRWVSIRVDSLGAIFSGAVAAYIVYSGRVQAGYAGFTLSVVLSFSRQILVWVRFYNLVEVQGMHFVCLESLSLRLTMF